jgi:ferritin-like metal-binding protein YciE
LKLPVLNLLQRKACNGRNIKENNDIINKTDQGIVRDACLIAAEQKIKHYEIASYGTLHAYAKTIGEVKAASLLA